MALTYIGPLHRSITEALPRFAATTPESSATFWPRPSALLRRHATHAHAWRGSRADPAGTLAHSSFLFRGQAMHPRCLHANTQEPPLRTVQRSPGPLTSRRCAESRCDSNPPQLECGQPGTLQAALPPASPPVSLLKLGHGHLKRRDVHPCARRAKQPQP